MSATINDLAIELGQFALDDELDGMDRAKGPNRRWADGRVEMAPARTENYRRLVEHRTGPGTRTARQGKKNVLQGR